MKGKFITIEGIEGAGKTTCISQIISIIQDSKIPFIQTREPGGTELGEEIRELLLNTRKIGMSSDAELLLLFAARAEHLERVIHPALSNGTWVICDRFIDASYAYQGEGRGIEHSRIKSLYKWIDKSLEPDLTLLLDLSVEQGFDRIQNRKILDRFESEDINFFQKVRKGYLDIAKFDPFRVKIVDSSRSLENVKNDISIIVKNFINEDSK